MSKCVKPPLHITHRSFQNIHISTFPAVGHLTNYNSLDFSSNPITSLRDLETLPLLSRLNLNGTLIESFESVKDQPSLTDVSLTNTPLGNYQMIDIMCIIAFGKNVRHVNGKPILKAHRATGLRLRKFLAPLLQHGWLVMGLEPIRCFHFRTRKRRVLRLSHISPFSDDDDDNVQQPQTHSITTKSRQVLQSHRTTPRTRASSNSRSTTQIPSNSSTAFTKRPITNQRTLQLSQSKQTNSTILPIPPVPRPDSSAPAHEPDLVSVVEDEEVFEDKSSIGDDNELCDSFDNSEGSRNAELRSGDVPSGICVDTPADAEVERMEYHDLTFDEAVRVLTPKSHPTLRPEFLILPSIRNGRCQCDIGRKSSKTKEDCSGKCSRLFTAGAPIGVAFYE
jgi:hypothetical protein